MTTAMTQQESIHERLQVPEEPYLHSDQSWPTETPDDPDEPYYNRPKRNKRKNFKPRCAPNFGFPEEDTSVKQENGDSNHTRAVNLSRRVSTDSNQNEPDKVNDSIRSPVNFSTSKNPFAISQLIKTNSPPRRRDSNGSDTNDENIVKNDDNIEAHDEVQTNGESNKLLRDYAMNTMKELLAIYGLSSNEVSDVVASQMRALEAMQGISGLPIPLALKRRHDSHDSGRRSSSATEDEYNHNSPPKTPEENVLHYKQKTLEYLSQQSLRLFDSGVPSNRNDDYEVSGSEDGEQTLDLSVGATKDADGQDMSTTSSTNNSISEFEQQTILMRKNLEDLANLQMQGLFHRNSSAGDLDDSQENMRNAVSSGLLSALTQLEQARKAAGQTQNIDYSRYVKRYGSSLECGSTYCKDLGYREHFHCMDCTARVFCKKEEMIRHFKWHKKRDESLAHGFMRYSPVDDCSERYRDCPHNRSQTHYHCIHDGCDKVYISTSDVQMHANYHRKDSAILQEGFQRFRATENCTASHCIFRDQRTTHFHCRRTGCTYTFKNKADMEKHKTYHIKDEQLARDGFKKYLKTEGCPYHGCRLSRVCNHIHCTRRGCNYVLHSSSQLYTHKRKHERQDREALGAFSLQSPLVQNSLTSPTNSFYGESDETVNISSGDLDGTLSGYSPTAIEDAFRKYVETYQGGRDPDDKCPRCPAFNKHYHCLGTGCSLAHSCQTTMMKHALEHEQQSQISEAYFTTYSRSNPCPDTACQHIKDVLHYHCNWESCHMVILSNEDQPFKRMEHYRQHALGKPRSPNLAARLAPNLASQLGHPGPLPNLAQLAQMAPNLVGHPNLQAQLGLASSPMVIHPPSMQHITASSSLDEMFSRKRGRPPKNRVVEVWTDNITPQAIFTSFKLPKSNQSPTPPAVTTVMPCTEEFSRIKFQNFEVYSSPETCASVHPSCQLKLARQHLHCAQCNFASDNHGTMEVHAKETHNIAVLLEGFEFFSNYEQCSQPNCFKNQLRSHFHCTQGSYCTTILTQYSTVATHKHVKEEDDVKDYSVREKEMGETTDGVKEEVFEKDADGALNISVVKATGTFYPSSHLKKSPSPRASESPRCENKPTSGIPSHCSDQNCPLFKKGTHYHCIHCKEPYGDLKNLYSHMVKRHSPTPETAPLGLAATKESLEREYPEISILPSTAASTQNQHTSPPNATDQVQAVQNLLLQQYLSATSLPQPQQKKPSTSSNMQDYQHQYGMLSGLNPAHLAQMAFLSQGASPFPLYHSMMYPPELLLEQSLIPGLPQHPLDKEVELLKKSQAVRGPHMRIMKDEPIPDGYLRFRFNEDCAYQHCGYREHQTHFHCTRKDCGYSFCDKTRFVQHTARHERLDTLMGGDFQQYRANVFCNRSDCAHANNFGATQNKASHFHCLKCEFVCTDTNKVVAHRRQHQKMDSIQAAGFDKFPPSKGCGFEPQCIHSKKQTHYHCLQCGFAVLGLSQMTSHKYKHQDQNQGASTSSNN